MDYYREAYRIDNTAWLGESMNHLAASSTKPEEAVNIDLSRKTTSSVCHKHTNIK